MRWKFKLVGLFCSILICGGIAGTGDQQILSYHRTIDTPVGKVGIWKITEIDPTYTNQEYWVLFGRLGKWHLKSPKQGNSIPLLTIFLLLCMAGALAAVAKERTAAAVASGSSGGDRIK